LALPAIGAAAVMFVLTQNLKKRVSIPLMKANEIAT